MSETPMTEARIEEIVEEWDREAIRHEQMERLLDGMDPGALRALIADWRAKKAEIERRIDPADLLSASSALDAAGWRLVHKDKIPADVEAMRAKCQAAVEALHDPQDDGWEDALNAAINAIRRA